jgi:hypothetical protein
VAGKGKQFAKRLSHELQLSKAAINFRSSSNCDFSHLTVEVIINLAGILRSVFIIT